jgi:DNA repair protein RadC
MDNKKEDGIPTWRHPGGKLVEKGAHSLTDAELLAIIISTGTKGKSAEDIANEILNKFGSFQGMTNHKLSRFLEFKGLGEVKIVRIAAAFEIAKRIVERVIKDYER